VPRHPAGDRVDRVVDVDAALFEYLGELGDALRGAAKGEPSAQKT